MDGAAPEDTVVDRAAVAEREKQEFAASTPMPREEDKLGVDDGAGRVLRSRGDERCETVSRSSSDQRSRKPQPLISRPYSAHIRVPARRTIWLSRPCHFEDEGVGEDPPNVARLDLVTARCSFAAANAVPIGVELARRCVFHESPKRGWSRESSGACGSQSGTDRLLYRHPTRSDCTGRANR